MAFGVVLQLMNGVKAQGVDVEVFKPPQSVVDNVAAHALGMFLVEVHGPTPWGVVGISEVWTKLAQVVAIGSQVVINDIQAHAQSRLVGGIYETLKCRRAAVRLMYPVRCHTVVSPAVAAREGRDRHEFDDVDS